MFKILLANEVGILCMLHLFVTKMYVTYLCNRDWDIVYVTSRGDISL